tara:strand:+ start:9173 stop:10378 length:1206 start_codon:yes stop_codon:yes gene_type:complete
VEQKNKYLSFLSKHLAFFVLGFASLSFFIVNILLKEKLSSSDYGLYSLLITYLSLISSFGLLGFEQVLLRTTKIAKKKILVQRNILFPIFFILIFISFLSSYLFLHYYDYSFSFISFLIFTLLAISIKILFNLFRLLSSFTLAQIILNTWRIGLLIIVILCVFYNLVISLEILFGSICVVLFLTFFFSYKLKKYIDFVNEFNKSKLFKKSILFFLSLITISSINFGDRFFIENRFGIEDLGIYFFYINIFLFPFTLFQSYLGFREIVIFKKKYNQKVLNNKLRIALFYSLIFGFCLLIIAFLIDISGLYHLDFKLNFNMILLLVFLGVIKVCYSLLSSAIGAVCNNKMLYKINRDSIISIILIIPLIYYFAYDMTTTLFFLIALWLIRCIIWYRQLLKYES